MSTHRFNRREFTKKVAASGAALTVGAKSELATALPREGAGQGSWLQAKNYLSDVLGADLAKDKLYRIGRIASAVEENGDALFAAPLIALTPQLQDGAETGMAYLRFRLYGSQVVCMLISRDNRPWTHESPMLEWSAGMEKRRRA